METLKAVLGFIFCVIVFSFTFPPMAIAMILVTIGFFIYYLIFGGEDD